MTDTPTALDPIELPDGMSIVVPEGADVLDGLTIAELDVASRQLGGDVYPIAQGRTVANPAAGSRWKALALLAWLWAKRTNPHAKLAPFLDLSAVQLYEVLGFHRADPDQAGPEVPAGAIPVPEELGNPTAPSPA